MKKLIFTAAVCGVFSSCFNYGIRGSGNIISENRNLSGFTGISSSSSIDVEVQQGTEFEVTAEADDNLIQNLKTKVEGDKLKIYIGDNVSVRNGTFRVKVTAPEINYLKASSSSSIDVTGTLKSGGKIEMYCSSSADITADVDAPDVKADASSSATITLSGRTKNLFAEASSSAEVNAYELLSENTTANASSSGSTDVFASVALKAKASSSGDINYRGAAKVEATTNSSGTVSKHD